MPPVPFLPYPYGMAILRSSEASSGIDGGTRTKTEQNRAVKKRAYNVQRSWEYESEMISEH